MSGCKLRQLVSLLSINPEPSWIECTPRGEAHVYDANQKASQHIASIVPAKGCP